MVFFHASHFASFLDFLTPSAMRMFIPSTFCISTDLVTKFIQCLVNVSRFQAELRKKWRMVTYNLRSRFNSLMEEVIPKLSPRTMNPIICLLYTSDAADEEDSVDLGGRRIIKKKKK